MALVPTRLGSNKKKEEKKKVNFASNPANRVTV